MEATIKFKDGTEITAEVNGSCYVTDKKPGIPEDLSGLVIVTEKETKTFNVALFVECASVDNRYWFTFIEKPVEMIQAEEIERLKVLNEFLEGCIMEMSEEVYK